MALRHRPPSNAPEHEERDDAIIASALRWSLVVMLGLAGVGGGVWWWISSAPVKPPTSESTLTLPTSRLRPDVSMPPMPFSDITTHSGIDFIHENGASGEKLLPETMGGGCAFLDFDNDGDQDLLLINGCHWPWDTPANATPETMALYANDGTGMFENITVGSGLDVSLYGTGVAVGDYDGDGKVDLFVSSVGFDRLFRNLGEGIFVDVTAQAGVAGEETDWGTSCGWFDADCDGDLDLFVSNYVAWSRELDRAQDFRLIGGGRAYGRPQNFAGSFPRLYRNNGEGLFSEVSKESGIQIRNAATDVRVGKSLGVVFDDLDGDGAMDVVVANDTVQNFLFHNRGNGFFDEIGNLAGIAYDIEGKARGAMGIDIGRFRNDNEVGIVIGNFANEMTALYVSQGHQLQFKDDAVSNGLGPETRLELSFGVLFVDVDLDGRLDILSANGHLEEDINKVQKTQFYEQSPELFWNCGSEHATEFLPVPVSLCGEAFCKPMVGRATAIADIDGDGDLDLVITASGARPRLLRNDQSLGHHWLRLKLVGEGDNSDAIGAMVEVHREGQIQSRCVSPTRSYQSQCELPLTFGLGVSDVVGTVVIRWPDGKKTELSSLAADRVHVVRKSDSETSTQKINEPQSYSR